MNTSRLDKTVEHDALLVELALYFDPGILDGKHYIRTGKATGVHWHQLWYVMHFLPETLFTCRRRCR